MPSTKKIAVRVAAISVALLIIPIISALDVSAAGPDRSTTNTGAQAWVGARIIDGTGKPAIENATLLVRNGRVEAIGKRVKIPAGAERIDATGKTIIPGLINAHGHLNSEDRLGVYLRDGITTILSLGGDKEFALRDFCAKAAPGTAPRLYVAGPIRDSSAIPGTVVVKTPEEARKSVDELIQNKPDIIKVRIDDFRGARQKMPPEVYGAVIDEAHKNGFRTAAHIVLLEDAKGVARAGVDYIAHSVRDQEVDGEFIALMKKRNVSYSPTLTRELAVFTYSETPAFFSDPFFLKEADPAEIEQMRDPKRQDTMRSDPSAQWYKEHMPVAMRNLKTLSDAGINIAMGTDSGGGPGRFQGYFEHLELEYETKAGLTPMQALVSATSGAAKAINISKEVGTLEKGKLADFVVLTANPLDDIKNTRAIESVWIGGVRVPAKKQ
jgi:imidazolonepropionase-like amidohydrolase